ncbi:MAG: hypothetical protein FD165_1762 [Gammaproteobacteria bacterium]|nr:MAG: hypothetical protein FD165_1762 [Gammaproteobacteria bacterium]TND04334.1 MAG: hypothetical protein FD120_1448 [Gammaproteobacteria bacterium]
MIKDRINSWKSAVRLVFCGMVLLPIGACAEMPMKGSQGMSSNDMSVVQISFDGKGALVIKDSEGKVVKPARVEFPIKATAIEEIETITLIRVRGSHYYLMRVGGTYYSIPLLH